MHECECVYGCMYVCICMYACLHVYKYDPRRQTRLKADNALGLDDVHFRLLPEQPPGTARVTGRRGDTYLSSILEELKVNLWDHIGIIVPQKGLKVTYSTTKR